jgi:hypothetical protein
VLPVIHEIQRSGIKSLRGVAGHGQRAASRPLVVVLGRRRGGDGAGNTGVRALGINGATSQSVRLTELPLPGVYLFA